MLQVRGQVVYIHCNITDLALMLPSLLLYVLISGKLHRISVLLLGPFSEFKEEETWKKRTNQRTLSVILKWKTEMGKWSVAEMLFGR